MTHSVRQDAENKPRQPVIVAGGISKRYFQNEYRPSLRHEAVRIFQSLAGRPSAPTHGEPFWALRDVSLTVCAGESVGVVGRNGAGKSTLFRLLCGITQPTTGQIQVRGRFATLISLGAGFQPERTGRENIFLSAAIQGASPQDIAGRITDIIAFAELGPFIDLPVKRYSSGMAARLGFSIAIHLLPDTIFLDEVLAVGDAAFQEKCIQRMMDIRAQGRTLMFVSHSADAVRKLCERTIWLDKGQVVMDGPTDEVLNAYAHALGQPTVS
jgi:lipopolysaccharide transport system ATP-binding protein